MTPSPSLQISMAANLGGFEIGRLQCREFLQRHGVEQPTIGAFELVLEECITNTLQYGYDGTGLRFIELQLEVSGEALHVQLVDDGRPFDPVSHPEPALPTKLDEARVGGLGILMVKRTTSRLQYAREGGCNRLTMSIPRRRVA